MLFTRVSESKVGMVFASEGPIERHQRVSRFADGGVASGKVWLLRGSSGEPLNCP